MNDKPQVAARKIGHVLIESGKKPDHQPAGSAAPPAPALALASVPSVSKAR